MAIGLERVQLQQRSAGTRWETTNDSLGGCAENKPFHFFRFRAALGPGHFSVAACMKVTLFFIFLLLITFAPATVYDTAREPLTSYN